MSNVTNQSVHVERHILDGYCVGIGVEHPGIIISAENEEELLKLFKEIIPIYNEGLAKYGIKDRVREVAVVEIPGTVE